jgi:hypothetical protein
MLSKVVLLAAAITLSVPTFADDPSKPTQSIAKRSASKSDSAGASKSNGGFHGRSISTAKSGAKKGTGNNAISSGDKGGSASLATLGGSSGRNGNLIAGVTMAEVKSAKSNNADARKEARAAHGVKSGNNAPVRKLEGDPPQK